MTQRAQELFLAYAHFCGERGVEPLIPIVKKAVVDAMSDIQLTAKLGADQILQILSDAHMSESPAVGVPTGSRAPLHESCLHVLRLKSHLNAYRVTGSSFEPHLSEVCTLHSIHRGYVPQRFCTYA